MIILDTNIYIGIERNNQRIIEKLSKLNLFGIPTITAPTYSEIYWGLLKGKKIEFENKLERLNKTNLQNTTKNSSKIFAEIKFHLEKIGKMIPLFDILIASIVIDNNATLITTDEHFKQIPGLKIIVLKFLSSMNS